MIEEISIHGTIPLCLLFKFTIISSLTDYTKHNELGPFLQTFFTLFYPNLN